MSDGLRTSYEFERGTIRLSREGGKATFWLTREEIQHLWQNYRPDQPLRICGTIPLSKKVAEMMRPHAQADGDDGSWAGCP